MASTPRSITYPVGSDSGDIANHFYNLATTTDNAITSAVTGMKNVIINGDFSIWQRGNGPFTAQGFTADRWYLSDGTDAVNSITRWSGWTHPAFDGTSIGDCATWNRTTAGTSESYLSQKIEGVRTLNGSTVTVSFWAWTTTGSVDITVKTAQYFGSGGSTSVYTGSFGTTGVTATTTPTRHSVTFTLGSMYNKTIGTRSTLMLYLSRAYNSTNGATGSVHITGVQFEIGPVMTPFENRPQGHELAMCQRYYYVSDSPASANAWDCIPLARGIAVSTNDIRWHIVTPVPLFDSLTKSLSLTGGARAYTTASSIDLNLTSGTYGGSGTNVWTGVGPVSNNAVAGYHYVMVGGASTAAKLAISAELP